MISQVAVALSFLLGGFSPVQPLEAAIPGPHDLDISVHETSISVTKGVERDRCALLIGVRQTPTILPGDALLLVEPLAIVYLNSFDVNGESHFYFGHLLPKGGLSALAQAITIRNTTNLFATSPLLRLVY